MPFTVKRKPRVVSIAAFVAAVEAAKERGLSSRESARRLGVPLIQAMSVAREAYALGGLVTMWTKVSEESLSAFQEARYWTLEHAPVEVRVAFPKRFIQCENPSS